MEDVGAEMLDHFIHKNAKKYKNLKSLKNAYPKLVVGIPATRIMEIVKQIQPNIVVMGSQGRTGLGLAFLGSTAENVMRQCPVPVTIVKSQKDTLEEV
jgi:nucleotide-binding universal stress UspA family protein